MMGTFVEIGVHGKQNSNRLAAIEQAFLKINEIDQLMSFHHPTSDLSRLNLAPVKQWIMVSAKTLRVLKLSLKLQKKSDGIFNVAIAQSLVNWNLLPGVSRTLSFRNFANPAFEIKGKKVRKLTLNKIDLGGIAKGFAVDQACSILQRNLKGISGYVNAGGDLRVFGRRIHKIHIRGEKKATGNFAVINLKNASIATSSSDSFAVSPYVQTNNGRPFLKNKTVFATAKSCALADGFTKIALMGSTSLVETLSKNLNIKWGQVI
jgi:thiamine biosynthesis lipoprotein